MTKPMAERRRVLSPAKRCRPFPGFSPFARFLFFSSVSPAPKALPLRPLLPTTPMEMVEPCARSRPRGSNGSNPRMKREILKLCKRTSHSSTQSLWIGVKLLLRIHFHDMLRNLNGFVDLILKQTTVGTVVRLENSDKEYVEGAAGGADHGSGPFAVIAALNLGKYADHECIGELREFLLQSCGEPDTKRMLRQLLEEQAKDVGLLISERAIFCPHELVPPLYDALFNEVSWATEDEPTEELREFFRFKYYLLIARIFEHTNQQKAKAKNSTDVPVIYMKKEDEIFKELSMLSFTFPLRSESMVPQELEKYKAKGLAMVVKADEVPRFQEKLKVLLTESYLF